MAAKTFGERLRTIRLDKGLTLREAAEQAGITYGFLGQIERDESQPSLDTLKALALAYGVAVGKLLD